MVFTYTDMWGSFGAGFMIGSVMGFTLTMVLFLRKASK